MDISHKDVFHAVTILEVVYLKRAVRRFENLSKDTVKIIFVSLLVKLKTDYSGKICA